MFLKLVCVALLATASLATVAKHKPCPELLNSTCTVTEVRIEPCRVPTSCRLKKATEATIAFDFTPYFSASELTADLYWASPTGDIPFDQLSNAPGCQYTSCPVESGKSQELNYSLRIGKILPSGHFDFKWKLRNAENSEQVCCFITRIQIY